MCLCNPCDERAIDITALKDAQFNLPNNELDDAFSDFLQRNSIPGGAVGIIHNNEIVTLRGHGFADLASSRPFTLGTPSLVGSIAKTLTALGSLVLAEQNRYSFARSINDYLPVPDPDYGEITVLQLLSHSSGINNKFPIFGGSFAPENEEDLKQLCEFDFNPPFQHLCADPDHPGIHPRSAYYTYYANNTINQNTGNGGEELPNGKYSNVNFTLLGTIVDMLTRNVSEFGKASGYENFIWHRVCLEAEMLSPCLMAKWRNIKNLATGYKGSTTAPYPSDLWGWEGPAGGWTMTIGDLCRLMIGINRNQIIGRTTRDELLLKPQSNIDVLESDFTNPKYGCGMVLFDDSNNGAGYMHHGDINGFTARFTYYLSHDVGVALLFNLQDVNKPAIADLSVELRDLFAPALVGIVAKPCPPQSAIDRLFKEYDRDIMHLIKQVNRGSGEVGASNQTLTRFLIRTEGENGKQLLRHFSKYEYEKAADIALRILKKRTPQPFEQPEDWV